jgi:hypothetical protein
MGDNLSLLILTFVVITLLLNSFEYLIEPVLSYDIRVVRGLLLIIGANGESKYSLFELNLLKTAKSVQLFLFKK